MGLDMYIEKFPRFGNFTPNELCLADDYVCWKKSLEQNPNTACSTFELFIGKPVSLPESTLQALQLLVKTTFPLWDTDHLYPMESISETVGYWRKANQIHKWFVDTVQGGEDDCCFHEEVSKQLIELLLSNCKTIRDNCKLVNGIMEHQEIAEELLPSAEGFFFGDTSYDEYYLDDINHTIDTLEKILSTTDFDKEMLFYVSSW